MMYQVNWNSGLDFYEHRVMAISSQDAADIIRLKHPGCEVTAVYRLIDMSGEWK